MSHTSFLGIPVDGDITKTGDRVEQRPLSEFEPLVRALLNDDTIVEFGWRQYTPYFNDGEPCLFGAHGLWVRTVDDEDEDEDALTVEYGHPTLGEFEYEYFGDEVPRQRRIKTYTGPDRARLERCLALDGAVDSGEFDDVLIEAFGDHAHITVKATGISVEFYGHD